ncbi:MAG: hypothetical protein ABSH20_31680, partial [Tepidisphaeraceae bacterium]
WTDVVIPEGTLVQIDTSAQDKIKTMAGGDAAACIGMAMQCYDDQNRLIRVLAPSGTITRLVLDDLGRTLSTWVGTNDSGATAADPTGNHATGNNMVKVSEDQYDNGGVGDGNLTRAIVFPNGNTGERATLYYYDWRDRLVETKSGVTYTDSAYTTTATEYTTDNTHPISFTIYDNLDEAIETRAYDGDAVTITSTNGVPNAPDASLLRADSTAQYDELGREFASHVFSVDPSSGNVSTSSLDSFIWFDQNGNVIKTAQPGGLVEKDAYDTAGRLATSYITDGGGDAAPGTSGNWFDAGNVSGDIVLQETDDQYDADGNLIFQIDRQRFDDATATGALGDPSSTGSTAKARVSYQAWYYDGAGRLSSTVNFGTNGGTLDGSGAGADLDPNNDGVAGRPASVPARSDTVLRTDYTYNAAGLNDTVTDPKGIVTKTEFDALSHTTKTIENYVDYDNDGNDSNDVLTGSQNITTEYTYDGDDHTLTMTAVLPDDQHQTTAYIYGVSPNDSLPSGLASNDLLAKVEYPDASSGNASTTNRQLFSYNAIGEQTAKQDQLGTVHCYQL